MSSSIDRAPSCQELREAVVSLQNLMADTSVPFFFAQGASPSTSGAMSLMLSLERLGLSEAIGELNGTLTQIAALTRVVSSPILGVAGMLNSGKSSVVASFLSSGGRARVLRGIDRVSGTQRFVYWLPEQWKQDRELWEALLDVIQSVFDQKLEMLSDDVKRAHIQYNQTSEDTDLLGVPLVATDPALTGLAIVDCPDVQRPDRHSTKEHSAQTRLAFLSRAAKVCSAFVFVANEANIHDADAVKTAGQLRDLMRRIPFHLLVNMATPGREPHEILDDVGYVMDQMGIGGCYLAYNYAIPGWKGVTPLELHRLVVEPDDRDARLPAGFKVDADPARNPPNPVAPNRFLITLPEQLHAAGLGGAQLCSLWEHFTRLQSQTLQDAKVRAERASDTVRELHKELLLLCRDKATDNKGNPRLPLSKEVTQTIQRSMEDSAPWYIRPLLYASRWTQGAITDGREWLGMRLRNQGGSLDEEQLDGLNKEALRAIDLAFAMRNRDFPDISCDAQTLERAWEHILRRTMLATTDVIESADGSKIDAAAAQAWKQVPSGRKAMAAFAAMGIVATGVLAVVTIPIDFGATAVVLGQASVTELIAVAGLSSFAAFGTAAITLSRALEEEVFLPYFSNLFYFACDAFGIPRALGNEAPRIVLRGSHRPLCVSQLPVEAPQPGCRQLIFLSANPDGRKKFEAAMTHCEKKLGACKPDLGQGLSS